MLTRLLFILTFIFSSLSFAETAKISQKKPTTVFAVLSTSMGLIEIKLFHTHAPKTVTNFISLAKGIKEFVDVETRKKTKRPFFNGLIFHRVVPNFMIQTGDPIGDGTGGTGFQIEQELHPDLEFDEAGIVAMAAPSSSDKNGSQFFITLSPQPKLNKIHTIFGQVTKGMDVVKAISEVKRDLHDKPVNPVNIKTLEIVYR